MKLSEVTIDRDEFYEYYERDCVREFNFKVMDRVRPRVYAVCAEFGAHNPALISMLSAEVVNWTLAQFLHDEECINKPDDDVTF